jgi:hypothetical protein
MSSQVATGVDALGARRSGARLLSATAFTGAVLAFALPFGTVANCDGEEVRFTGAELATFTVPPDPSTSGTLHADVERNAGVLAFALLLAAALGLVLAIVGRPRGGICAGFGLVAAQLLGLAILITGDAGGTPAAGFGLALLSFAVAGVVHLVDAVRARRRTGRRVWGYAFGRCVLALWPTLALIVLIAIALAAGA